MVAVTSENVGYTNIYSAPMEEEGLHVESSGSLLSTVGRLLDFFNPGSKKSESTTKPPTLVGVGQESYEDLYRRIAAARYEVVSLKAQLQAFEKMIPWTERMDLQTLRRPDLEKVGLRLKTKERELEGLIQEREVLNSANKQYVKVEAIRFEETYLKYLITEILDKGDPEGPLTSELICELGSLKRELHVEEEALESARLLPDTFPS